MKKIGFNHTSKILNAIKDKINAIIDKLIVDVKVNGTSVVVVNEDGEREADIDLSLTDQNVKQSPTTDNKDYRVLLSKSDNDTEETDIARKNTSFKYNPSTGNLQATLLNGNAIPSGTLGTIALTSDIPTQASDIGAIPTTEKGANNGVATLDASGKVPSSQIPGSVDEIIEGYYYNGSFYEDSAHTTLITPASGKIYVDLDSNKTYRWGGSVYVEISESLALGETQGTAYEGSKGKNLADRLDGLATVATSGSYNDLTAKPTIPDELADLADDSTHRLVTDTEKSTWNNKSATDENVYQQDIYNALGYGYSFPLLASCSPNDDTETNLVNKLPKVKWDSQNDWLKIYGFGGVQASILALALDGGPILNRIYGNPQANYVATTLPNHEGVLTTEKNAVLWKQQNVLGAKNLLTFPYYHGFSRTTNNVVFTVDNDGIITVGGTQASANASFYLMYNVKLPNGTYTLSDGGVGTTDTYLSCVYYTTPSASAQYYDVANNGSVTFTVDNWDRAIIRIWSRNGKTADNLVFKPMLRLSTIADDTFEPYAETNRQLTLNKLSWESNKASGVKNYFTYPYYHPMQGEVYPQRAVDYTDNGDGGIVANGTCDNTGNSYCQLLPSSTINAGMHRLILPKGRYHFSGGISDDYYINLSRGILSNPSATRTEIGTDYGDGFDFDVTEQQAEECYFCSFCFVAKNKTATNVVFYPMITRYEDTSDGYAIYAMTNTELTQMKADMDNIAPTETSGIAVNSYAVGDYMWWRHGFYRVTQAIAVGDSITTSKVTKTTLGAELKRALT